MKVETIKHPGHTVSCLSESMAEHFKNKIEKEQYEILKHNVYTLEKGDIVYDKYHGCGCGWVEIDKNGKSIDLQYFDENVVNWIDTDDGEVGVVSSEKVRELYFSLGQESQNGNMLELHTNELMPFILPNGNIRLFVNLSCHQLVRF